MTSIALKNPDPFDLAKTVAEKSGSSRGAIKYLQMFGKAGGVAGTGLGLYTAGKNVYDAPEPLKGQVVAQETGGILGGAGGSTLGTGLGVLGVGALAATPPGWVVIGGGILGGAIGGYLGSESGKDFGGKVYKWLKNRRLINYFQMNFHARQKTVGNIVYGICLSILMLPMMRSKLELLLRDLFLMPIPGYLCH